MYVTPPIVRPSRRVVIPGRCPVHPWRPARRSPARRPLSRWRRHLDTLNGNVQFHPTTGNVLFTATGVAMDPDCCCGAEGDPCADCEDGTPRYVHLAFAGIDLCDVFGCDPTTNGSGSFGDYCCEQAGSILPCRWNACEPDVYCSTPGHPECIGSGAGILVARVPGKWLAIIYDIEMGGNNVYFAAEISTANCETGGTAGNASTGCGDTVALFAGVPVFAGDYHFLGEGGSVTLTPFNC